MASEIRVDLGEPTVLMNITGVVHAKTVLDATEAEHRRVFDVNTLSDWMSNSPRNQNEQVAARFQGRLVEDPNQKYAKAWSGNRWGPQLKKLPFRKWEFSSTTRIWRIPPSP